MDVAAGIVGVLELFSDEDQHGAARQAAVERARLHIFRLRNATSSHPDLRHLDIAMELDPREERDLLEMSSSAYDTLSYPIPSTGLLCRLLIAFSKALADEKLRADTEAEAGGGSKVSSSRSPVHAASMPQADIIPYVRQQDVKPPQHILEIFFQAYVKAIGDQMPGLDTEVIGARIRDGSMSALLANALCAIGASLYDRAGQRPPVAEAHPSKVYLERASALIGAALQNPDLEGILALGVMAIRGILMGQMVSSAAIVSSAARLCIQLDLHRARPSSHRQPSPANELTNEDTERAKQIVGDDVFWMTYCLDRVTAIATARPHAIKDRDIDTPFPATLHKGEPCIFAALVRQLHYLGRLCEVSLASPSESHLSGGSEPDRATEIEIAAIGADLVGHYESLPTVLQLSAANLRRARERATRCRSSNFTSRTTWLCCIVTFFRKHP